MKVFHLDDARRARERVDAAPDRLSTRAALDTATAGIVVVAEACSAATR